MDDKLEGSEEKNAVEKAVAEKDSQSGQAPLKVVTGTQSTKSLNFELKPGAIVAHPNSSVIFVCG